MENVSFAFYGFTVSIKNNCSFQVAYHKIHFDFIRLSQLTRRYEIVKRINIFPITVNEFLFTRIKDLLHDSWECLNESKNETRFGGSLKPVSFTMTRFRKTRVRIKSRRKFNQVSRSLSSHRLPSHEPSAEQKMVTSSTHQCIKKYNRWIRISHWYCRLPITGDFLRMIEFYLQLTQPRQRRKREWRLNAI